MQNIRTFIYMLRQLMGILNAKQKRQAVVVFLFLIITSFLEMLGVSVIIPFVMAMLEPEKLMDYRIVSTVMELLQIRETQKLILFAAAGIVLVYVVKNAAILATGYYQTNYRNTLEKDLSVKMLNSYMYRPYIYFVNTNSSEMLRGITGDISSIATIIDSYASLLAEGMSCLFIGIMILFMDPLSALFLLGLAGITALLIILGFKKKTSKCGEVARTAFAERYRHSYQAVCGAKEVMVMDRRKEFVDAFARASETAKINNNKYLFISKIPSRLIETVFLSGLILLVCINTNNSGSKTEYISLLGALAIAAVRILPAVSNIANAMNSLVYNRPSLEAVCDNIREAEKYDSENRMVLSADNKIETLRTSLQQSIQVNGISWTYGENLPYVLDNLSLEIHKGEAVALIGESGAGKTTLADILLGLYKPQKGEISVDGRNLYEMLPAWAHMIGYIPQSVFLIDDTIRNNVAFGISEDQIDDTKIWKALEQAQLIKVIEELPLGLNTILGERGVKFSGGQRQRIAIARALYYDPDIMILDEATSALDNETETALMEAIDALHQSKTLIIVAHRLTTIRNCDTIYEIKGGKAVLVTKDKLNR